MKRVFIFFAAAAVVVLFELPAWADYTILLKNGRRFNVQDFHEQGGKIRFHGFGGEISIPKDKIQTISPAGEAKSVTQAPPRFGPGAVSKDELRAKEQKNAVAQNLADNPASEKKEIPKPSVKEEDAYRELIRKIDEQLKDLRGRYATETRGNTGSDLVLFTTEEAFRGHQEDLISRLRDAQYKAQGLASGGEAQSPPLSTNPPPAYTEKQKLLSDLRSRLHELESERERVIAEMKRNNIDTGSLSSE